jgi:hypothetical protein
MLDREFNLKPSKLYLILFSAIWLMSILIFLSLPLHIGLKLCGAVGLCGYGIYQVWRTALLKHRLSIISLRCHRDGRWHLYRPSTMLAATLRGDSTVTGMVSVLRFQVEKHRLPITCLVFKDALGSDRYRQLLSVVRTVV